jgi:hypothetical protein
VALVEMLQAVVVLIPAVRALLGKVLTEATVAEKQAVVVAALVPWVGMVARSTWPLMVVLEFLRLLLALVLVGLEARRTLLALLVTVVVLAIMTQVTQTLVVVVRLALVLHHLALLAVLVLLSSKFQTKQT